MNNKILFADLDHTLLCDDKSISEKNRAAIQKMLERGHYFVLATGRPVESGRIVAKDLGLTSPGCYMIAFNGAVVYDCAADRVLYKSALPIEVAQEIFDRAHKAGIYAQTYNTVDIVTKRHTKELDYYVERSHMTYKLTRRISDCLDSEPQKVILIHLEDDEKLNVVFNDYMNCLMGDPTEEKEKAIIDKAAEMGCEYYCLDCGWYDKGFWWDRVGE